MRKQLLMIAALGCLAVVVVGSNSGFTAMQDALKQDAPKQDAPKQDAPKQDAPKQDAPKESKTQPKDVVLGKDSQSDKYGEVAFSHENHATKNYSIDGKSIISCVECHHTDQPAAALKAPLKTSERDVVLTAKLLEAADAKPVKDCRVCHLQAGDDSAPMPAVTYPDKTTATKLTNEVAYHMNCNVCHDKALAARPELKGKAHASTDCVPCHKPAD